jgi:lipopolysaccharide assembly outer membrane protein LptD (OstA)
VTDFLSWNYKNRTVESDKPVQVVQYEDRVTITGNQASVNLDKQIAHLSGGVQGFSSRNQAKLYATDLTWNIASKIVEATGNVVYEQTDPKFHLTGEHAIGILQQNSVVVSGNQKDRVVTEIYPN